MNNEKFMNQKVSEMSVSELAEAIKIKSVQSTNEEKIKVGAKVKSIYECSACRGKILTVIRIDSTTPYPITTKTDEGHEEIFRFNALELVKEPKAEWIDITKDCEFEFKQNVGGEGFGYIDIYHNGDKIGTCLSHIVMRIDRNKNYKLEKIGIEGNSQFKIN